MTGPFITDEDALFAKSKSPKVIGQTKINALLNSLNIDMTDAQLDSVITQVKALRDTYQAWEVFYQDLELRKRRYQGFQAVVLALDLTTAAAAMGTTPQAINAVMGGYAQMEGARILELQALWNAGQLPDRPVLSDPSKEVIDSEPTAPAPAPEPDPADTQEIPVIPEVPEVDTTGTV